MPIYILKIIQSICLFTTIIIIFGFNFINYYLVEDYETMWRIAMDGISWVMFLLMLHVWIGYSIKGNELKIVLSGWAALYLLINLVVVFFNWNLYTRGVIEIYWITTLALISHLVVKLWRQKL